MRLLQKSHAKGLPCVYLPLERGAINTIQAAKRMAPNEAPVLFQYTPSRPPPAAFDHLSKPPEATREAKGSPPARELARTSRRNFVVSIQPSPDFLFRAPPSHFDAHTSRRSSGNVIVALADLMNPTLAEFFWRGRWTHHHAHLRTPRKHDTTPFDGVRPGRLLTRLRSRLRPTRS